MSALQSRALAAPSHDVRRPPESPGRFRHELYAVPEPAEGHDGVTWVRIVVGNALSGLM
ncbi:hypothetical protein [Falsiroseomonas tokyonensis]|uniref:Uncharacterized protein n=1 Tax=Falsiroseomonas tokyonensis TaxID=430521 RepID=A0ABV7BTC9_9PROT|nr:hypothetical protein [Falsiroseomonas tokyonensis]MBU8537348.1 hypothetical protein [Falsiroseomonas tokyonensis]